MLRNMLIVKTYFNVLNLAGSLRLIGGWQQHVAFFKNILLATEEQIEYYNPPRPKQVPQPVPETDEDEEDEPRDVDIGDIAENIIFWIF